MCVVIGQYLVYHFEHQLYYPSIGSPSFDYVDTSKSVVNMPHILSTRALGVSVKSGDFNNANHPLGQACLSQ